MPLFEVEGDRPQIVPGPRAGAGTTAHRVVESHIDGLLGEQIFPVSPGAGPDEPHLLALDASGAPVVVELVARLDDAALSRALDHAGAAGRMTRGQLASLYREGPHAFHRDVADFYDDVPIMRSQQGRPGVRLIIICQEADEGVLNAVDFLRQPNMPVEVLRLGLVHGADGRRFVDVSPLVIHPDSAPDRPELVARPEGIAPLTSLTERLPAAAGETWEVDPSRGTREGVPADGVPASQRVPATGPTPTPVQGTPRATPPAPTPAPLASEPLTPERVPEPLASERVPEPLAFERVPEPLAFERVPEPLAFERVPEPLAFERVPEPLASERVPEPFTLPMAASAPDPDPTPYGPKPSVVRRRSRTDRFTTRDPDPLAEPAEVDATTYLPPLGYDAPHRIPRDLDLGPASPIEAMLAWRPARLWDAEPADAPVPVPSSGERAAVAFGEVFSTISNPLDPDWVAPVASDGAMSDGATPDGATLDGATWDRATWDRSAWEPPYEPPRLPEPCPEPAAPAPAPAPASAPVPVPVPWEPEQTTSSAPIVADEDTDADLAALAAALGVPTALRWERPRRGQRFDALLLPDGTIELPDGGRYRHPDIAASAASGSYAADGWTVWRMRASGETLAEVFRARFA